MSDTNDTSKSTIEKLIRLKRYEQPREGYFQEFLREFQRRQRAELLQRSARGLLLERIGTYFSGLSSVGRLQWASAGVAACAGVAAVAVWAMGAVNGGAGPENSAMQVASEEREAPGSGAPRIRISEQPNRSSLPEYDVRKLTVVPVNAQRNDISPEATRVGDGPTAPDESSRLRNF